MKTRLNTYAPLGLLMLILSLTCCTEDNNEWSKDYDIEWPVSTITSVQPMSASAGDVITISGANLQFTNILYFGAIDCTKDILTKSETQLTLRLPATVVQVGTVSVYNLYRRMYVFTDLFTPLP